MSPSAPLTTVEYASSVAPCILLASFVCACASASPTALAEVAVVARGGALYPQLDHVTHRPTRRARAGDDDAERGRGEDGGGAGSDEPPPRDYRVVAFVVGGGVVRVRSMRKVADGVSGCLASHADGGEVRGRCGRSCRCHCCGRFFARASCCLLPSLLGRPRVRSGQSSGDQGRECEDSGEGDGDLEG